MYRHLHFTSSKSWDQSSSSISGSGYCPKLVFWCFVFWTYCDFLTWTLLCQLCPLCHKSGSNALEHRMQTQSRLGAREERYERDSYYIAQVWLIARLLACAHQVSTCRRAKRPSASPRSEAFCRGAVSPRLWRLWASEAGLWENGEGIVVELSWNSFSIQRHKPRGCLLGTAKVLVF